MDHVFPLFPSLTKATILRKEFMDHCDVLEKHFKALIPPNTIRIQFEDFLSINMRTVQLRFVLQQSLDHVVYPDFLWYNLTPF